MEQKKFKDLKAGDKLYVFSFGDGYVGEIMSFEVLKAEPRWVNIDELDIHIDTDEIDNIFTVNIVSNPVIGWSIDNFVFSADKKSLFAKRKEIITERINELESEREYYDKLLMECSENQDKLSEHAKSEIFNLEKRKQHYKQVLTDLENLEEHDDIDLVISKGDFKVIISNSGSCKTPDACEAVYALRNLIQAYKTKIVLFDKRIEDIKHDYE